MPLAISFEKTTSCSTLYPSLKCYILSTVFPDCLLKTEPLIPLQFSVSDVFLDSMISHLLSPQEYNCNKGSIILPVVFTVIFSPPRIVSGTKEFATKI